MARRKAIKLDPETVFLSGIYCERVHKDITQSPLWPIIVAAHTVTEGHARVSKWIKKDLAWTGTTGESQTVEFTTKEGMPFSEVYFTASGEFAFRLKRDLNYGNWDKSISTKNVKYLINKLHRDNDDLRNAFIHTAKFSFMRCVNERLRTMVDESIDKLTGATLSVAPTAVLSSEATTALARVFMGAISKDQIRPDLQSEILQQYEEYKKVRDKFDAAVEYIANAMSNEKIVLFPNTDGSLVVGKINPTRLREAAVEYATVGRLRGSYEYTTDDPPPGNFYREECATLPFKWYAGLSDMPDELRQELEIQLVILKAHTGSDELLPITWDETQNRSHNKAFFDIDVFANMFGKRIMYVLNT